jgi:adenylate cyclase
VRLYLREIGNIKLLNSEEQPTHEPLKQAPYSSGLQAWCRLNGFITNMTSSQHCGMARSAPQGDEVVSQMVQIMLEEVNRTLTKAFPDTTPVTITVTCYEQLIAQT